MRHITAASCAGYVLRLPYIDRTSGGCCGITTLRHHVGEEHFFHLRHTDLYKRHLCLHPVKDVAPGHPVCLLSPIRLLLAPFMRDHPGLPLLLEHGLDLRAPGEELYGDEATLDTEHEAETRNRAIITVIKGDALGTQLLQRLLQLG